MLFLSERDGGILVEGVCRTAGQLVSLDRKCPHFINYLKDLAFMPEDSSCQHGEEFLRHSP